MSKLSETNALIATVETVNTEHGIKLSNKALLCDIAKSLAIIADSLSEKEEEEEA